VTPRQRLFAGAAATVIAIAAAVALWPRSATFSYLDGETAALVASLPSPPARGSAEERRELDALLVIQGSRTPTDAAAARADRKTEASRFYPTLGLPENASLPHVKRLVDNAEDDVRLYVRAAKEHFRRLRPYVVEVRIEPCISDVSEALSYPSGHSAYGYTAAQVLAELAPTRRGALLARADEYARQRMVCGVHFPSDIAAGRHAAEWLVPKMAVNPDFARDAAAARAEMSAALAAVAAAASPAGAD
jgi:acid phosphatase (class A)